MNVIPPVNAARRIRPGRRQSLRQVLDLQDIAHRAAKGLEEDFNRTESREERARVAGAISNLGKAWVSLQDSKREILGRPKAGVRKVDAKKDSAKVCQAISLFASEEPPAAVEPAENKSEPRQILQPAMPSPDPRRSAEEAVKKSEPGTAEILLE